MTNIQARVLATGLIWTALTVLGVAAMVTATGSASFMLFVCIAGALIATSVVWKGAEANQSAIEEAEKAKRRTRLDRMMDNLDERELEELRYRLTNDQSDKLVSLDDLELVRTEYRE